MSPNKIIELYKNLGETPLECIDRFRAENLDYKDENMTYLGRLDPMAEGLLLVLAGNTRDKKKYLDLDKTYEFEVLWGFETDTYDILGKVTNHGGLPKNLEHKMPSLLKKILAKKTQSYPSYSSRTVGGKPLFSWAREGRIHEIEVPTRSIKIFNLEHKHTRLESKENLLKEIVAKISLVGGDFRQKEILDTWVRALGSHPEEKALVSSFVVDVSSGTYVRGLAHEMGQILFCGALAYSIKRTRVGEYKN